MGILTTNCPHCGTQSVGFQIIFSKTPKDNSYNQHNCLAVCGGCLRPICFIAVRNDSTETPHQFVGNISGKYQISQTWPLPKPIAIPPHCPKAVSGRFNEGEQAFERKNWNAAVAMYRSALDIATKEMVPEAASKLMAARLKWMLDNGRLTQDLFDWASHVRIGGNEALHDPDDFGEGDAKPLRYFTEMFLRYVYELPGEVARLRGAKAEA